MWTCQSKFWTAHQAEVHKPEKDTISAATAAETKAEVQYLYSIRFQVPTQHREEYFPKNIRDFLKSSSHQQLQNYIANYKPAIRKSIKTAKDDANKAPRIFNYQGFTRIRAAPKATSTRQTTPHLDQRNETIRPCPGSPPEDAPNTPQRHSLKQRTLTGAEPPENTTEHQVPTENHHKHSKWKLLHVVQDRFKNFFVKK
jgi:hypothetical protein